MKPASGPICRQRPLVLMKGYNSSPWSQRLPAEAGPLRLCKPGGSLRIASQPALANSLQSSSKSCSAFSARTRELSCGVRAGLMPAPRPWVRQICLAALGVNRWSSDVPAGCYQSPFHHGRTHPLEDRGCALRHALWATFSYGPVASSQPISQGDHKFEQL